MRIIYFAHSVLNRGGDKMVLAHLGHLAASGHEVVIRSNVVDTIFPIHPAIAVEKPGLSSKLGTLVSALVEKQQADLVIASIVPTAVLLAFRNRVLHFAQDDNQTAYASLLLRAVMCALYFLAFSAFRIPTITVSQALAQTFKKRFGADSSVVSNGVDTGVFFPSPSADLVSAKAERKAILLLSRSDPRKGFDIARQVIARLDESAPFPFEVWTVGDDPAWDDFPGIHRHFGVVDEARLRSLMSSADVFLYPSRSEGFPLMVLEAFACKCPVVTTEAVPYVLHGANAMVCSIGDYEALTDCVVQIIESGDLAATITGTAFRYALDHTLAGATRDFELAALAAAGYRPA